MNSVTAEKHAVVGAGLAGLAAGYRLKQAGWQVTVLESRDYPGGRAASIRKGDYLIDTGATGVGDCYTEYLALAQELGLADKMVKSSQITATLRAGKLYEVDGERPIVSGALRRCFPGLVNF